MEDLLLIPLENRVKTFSFIDRYFKSYIDKETNSYFYYHSNGIIVSGLTNDHPIIKDNLQIKCMKILNKEYSSFSKNCKDLVKGKKKKGNLRLHPGSKICVIYTTCEKKFKIKSKFSGHIIEVNEKIIDNYEFLKTNPETNSFLCIIQPFKEFDPKKFLE